METQLYLNFGFWDKLPYHEKEGYFNRLIEKKVEDLSGKKSLYSNSYYSRDAFFRFIIKKHMRS